MKNGGISDGKAVATERLWCRLQRLRGMGTRSQLRIRMSLPLQPSAADAAERGTRAGWAP